MATAGAVATAVSAVVALLPDPDPADRASFTSSRVRAPHGLSDFALRVEFRANPDAAGLAPAVPRRPTALRIGPLPAPAPPAPSPTDTSSTGPADTASSAGTGGTGSTGTGSTGTGSTVTGSAGTGSTGTGSTGTGGTGSGTTTPTAPPTLSAPRMLSLPADVLDRFAERMVRQEPLREFHLPDHLRTVTVTTVGDPAEVVAPSPLVALVDPVDEQGRTVRPATAARRLADRLSATRAERRDDGRKDPVGALVSVDMDLEGLRGQRLLLFWRLFPEAGTRPLPRAWSRPTVAYQLEPGTEHDTASVDLWVPLPRGRGSYVVNLVLTTEDGARLASADTDPVD